MPLEKPKAQKSASLQAVLEKYILFDIFSNSRAWTNSGKLDFYF